MDAREIFDHAPQYTNPYPGGSVPPMSCDANGQNCILLVSSFPTFPTTNTNPPPIRTGLNTISSQVAAANDASGTSSTFSDPSTAAASSSVNPSSFPTIFLPSPDSYPHHHGVSAGTIAAAVIMSLLFLLVISGIIFFCCRRKRDPTAAAATGESELKDLPPSPTNGLPQSGPPTQQHQYAGAYLPGGQGSSGVTSSSSYPGPPPTTQQFTTNRTFHGDDAPPPPYPGPPGPAILTRSPSGHVLAHPQPVRTSTTPLNAANLGAFNQENGTRVGGMRDPFANPDPDAVSEISLARHQADGRRRRDGDEESIVSEASFTAGREAVRSRDMV